MKEVWHYVTPRQHPGCKIILILASSSAPLSSFFFSCHYCFLLSTLVTLSLLQCVHSVCDDKGFYLDMERCIRKYKLIKLVILMQLF